MPFECLPVRELLNMPEVGLELVHLDASSVLAVALVVGSVLVSWPRCVVNLLRHHRHLSLEEAVTQTSTILSYLLDTALEEVRISWQPLLHFAAARVLRICCLHPTRILAVLPPM